MTRVRWNFFRRVWVCSTSRRRVMQSHSSRKRFLHEYRTKFYITMCENTDFLTRSVRKTAFYTRSDIKVIVFLNGSTEFDDRNMCCSCQLEYLWEKIWFFFNRGKKVFSYFQTFFLTLCFRDTPLLKKKLRSSSLICIYFSQIFCTYTAWLKKKILRGVPCVHV